MRQPAFQLPPAPPLLIAMALLTWGWQCQFLSYAIVMAALVELARLVSFRWAITEKEFNTLSDFSGVMFFATVIYIFTDEGARGIFVILQVMPFILFPLLITQIYSQAGRMKLSALLVSLRKLDPALSPEAQSQTDISLPYFVICLLASSAGNQRTMVFFFLCGILIAFALWTIRPRRFATTTWLLSIILALSLAYGMQLGLRHLQASIEASFLGIFDQFMWRYRDPNRATTAMGSLGRLKLSDRIVLRMKAPEKLTQPMLLREASYSNFGHGIWSSQNSGFVVIDPSAERTWTLNEGGKDEQTLSISTYMIREEGVIPLPHGANTIRNITAIEIARNAYGAVMMDIREGWIQYDVDYDGVVSADSPPTEADLSIIPYYREDFSNLARQLELETMDDVAAVAAVERFFRNNFSYSLNRRQRFPRGKYMADFLFRSRSGHCEYFATATALLLRSAGIPTRYAVGYSVDEYSALEGQYIARARHAHSWTMVYINDQWTVVDTTPAVWAPQEAENASAVEPILDLWSWVAFTWSMWQSADATEDEEDSNYLLWLLIPLVLVLAWRIYFRERVLRTQVKPQANDSIECPGLDSAFYQVIECLEQHSTPRKNGETLAQWLQGISRGFLDTSLQKALALHTRYRFDPAGISEQEHLQLGKLSSELLDRHLELVARGQPSPGKTT